LGRRFKPSTFEFAIDETKIAVALRLRKPLLDLLDRGRGARHDGGVLGHHDAEPLRGADEIAGLARRLHQPADVGCATPPYRRGVTAGRVARRGQPTVARQNDRCEIESSQVGAGGRRDSRKGHVAGSEGVR